MLVSSPLAEKRQMSAAATPLGGRSNGTGFPARVKELVMVENAPSAATFKSTPAFVKETPAVVGSTTIMSLPLAEGAALVSEMSSADTLGAATIRETLLEVVLSGLWIWTDRFPALATSAGVTGAVHSVTTLHTVHSVRSAMRRTEPGPGAEAAKL